MFIFKFELFKKKKQNKTKAKLQSIPVKFESI